MGLIKTIWSEITHAIETVTNAIDYFIGNILDSLPPVVTSSHNNNYVLCDDDRKYIEDSASKLREHLGEKPVNTLLSMDGRQRYDAIVNLTSELGELYGLDGIRIEFAQLDKKHCGYYSRKENKLVLNIRHLLTNNYSLTKEFLDTVFHEFRHAVQWKIITSRDLCGYDEEFAIKLIDSLYNYIPYSQNPIAYYKQFAELDAREIAMYILEE